MTDEAKLIEEARQGVKEAFAQIVRLHQAPVRAFVARYIRNWDVVEDVAQESFLCAYHGLANFRGGSTLRTWLLGIARNQALKYIRDEGIRVGGGANSLQDTVFTWLAERIEQEAEDVSRREREILALQTCLDGLPRSSAGLVSEHYLDGRTAADIARRSGKTGSAVWMTLMRIRTVLRRCVELRVARSGAGHE
jgi:RNA polymerase sigma-70 factor (ECF subfamily)